jgi:hypothetical protein
MNTSKIKNKNIKKQYIPVTEVNNSEDKPIFMFNNFCCESIEVEDFNNFYCNQQKSISAVNFSCVKLFFLRSSFIKLPILF